MVRHVCTVRITIPRWIVDTVCVLLNSLVEHASVSDGVPDSLIT